MKKIIFILLLLFTLNVKAEVDCNRLLEITNSCTASDGLLKIKGGEEVNCTISFSSIESDTCLPTKESLKEITFDLVVNPSLSIINDIVGDGFSKVGNKFTKETPSSEGTIYTYSIKTNTISVDTEYSLLLNVLDTKNADDEYTSANVYGSNLSLKVMRDKSKINTLSKLDVSGYNLTPIFSSSVLDYKLTVDTNTSKVNINPTPSDELSTINGDTGEKTLSYGDNLFKINVISESGSTKTYTLTVTRQDYRSKENGLKNIIVSNTSMVFDPNKLRYDLEVDKEIDKLTVTSSLIDPRSQYIEGSSSINKTLVFGNNVVVIKTKAENGDIKEYIINIVRNDGKSSVNSLSTLSVIGFEKEFNFTPETLNYSFKVSSIVKEVELKSTMTSTKSTYVEKFGNRKVSLNVGLNKVEIKVKSEKDVIKTYTLNITREDPKDSTSIKSFKVDVEEFKFDPKILEYEFEVSNLLEKLKIDIVTEENTTKVNITGNDKLVVGENNIKIEILSESGKNKIYNLLVIKRDKASTISKLKDILIKDYDIDFKSDKFEYNLKIDDENKLDISVEKLDTLTKYSVLGNNNLKYGSVIKIIASAEDGSSTEYTIKITKEINALIPLGILTLSITIISIIVSSKKNHSKIIKKEKPKFINRSPENLVVVPKKEVVKIPSIPEVDEIKKEDEIPSIPEVVEIKKEDEILDI